MARRTMNREEAEMLAVRALSFVAADPELLPRFLSLSGIDAAAVRDAAREPGFLAGVLRFVTDHEPTLLRFAEETGVSPQDAVDALGLLPFGGHGEG
ncbi:MAG: DUF3572 domain-containing protein [Rhizobiaceae bacterium]|jgi:hypothetical protein